MQLGTFNESRYNWLSSCLPNLDDCSRWCCVDDGGSDSDDVQRLEFRFRVLGIAAMNVSDFLSVKSGVPCFPSLPERAC